MDSFTDDAQRRDAAATEASTGDAGLPLLLEARVPRVGIWWLMPDGSLVEFAREFREDPDHVRGNAQGHLDHWNAWDRVRQAHPEVAGRDWAEVPRGRVLMRTQGGRRVFAIITSRELAASPAVMTLVMRTFSLPPAPVTVVEPDPHYELHVDPDEWDNF
jgi:hypothetical protein